MTMTRKTESTTRPGWGTAAGATGSAAAPAGVGAGAVAAVEEGAGPDVVVRRLVSWVASAISVSALLSVVVHVALVAVAAVMTVGIGGGRGPASDRAGRDYELVTSDASLMGLSEAPLEVDAPAAAAESELPDLPTAGVMEGAGGVDAPASGEGLGEIADGLGGAGGGDIGDGEGLGSGGAGSGGASFFGVEAQGTRFAYIVDISGSMQGDKLASLKLELIESIQGMLEHMSYLVVCFASTPQPLAEHRKWKDATEDGKRWAAAQIYKLQAEGGTQPWGAFELVLTAKPAPDAIYFMTDGQFDPEVADQIAIRNRGGKKVPIHCITFVDDSSEELMRKIAGQSGGSYTHVKGPR